MIQKLSKLILAPTTVIFILGAMTAGAGEVDPNQADWHKKYKQQENAPDPAKMLLNEDKEPALKDGFVDLFNGKDLTGWTPKGGTAKFEVKDGMIVGTVVKDSPSTYLSTDKADYTDFVFTCEIKWEIDLNSGVMFRAAVRKKKDKAKSGKVLFRNLRVKELKAAAK